SAERSCASLTWTERNWTPARSATCAITERVVPGRILREFGGERTSPPMTTCTAEAEASSSSVAQQYRLRRVSVRGQLTQQHVCQQCDGLDIAPGPAGVGGRHALQPRLQGGCADGG